MKTSIEFLTLTRDACQTLDAKFLSGPHTQTLALILSACHRGVGIGRLSKELGLPLKLLQKYLSLLNKEGFLLAKKISPSEIIFQTTETGARCLATIVDLYHSCDNSAKSPIHEATGLFRLYQGCKTCTTHPSYPQIPPITLHVNGRCQLCQSPTSDETETNLKKPYS